MNTLCNAALTPNAQNLRRNMTGEERHLWYDYLKSLPVNVYRQKVIGRYIVDFCIPAAGLVIELDGSQHFAEDGIESDAVRDAFLKRCGYTVLRYANTDVNQHFQSVCEDIQSHLSLPLEGKVAERSEVE